MSQPSGPRSFFPPVPAEFRPFVEFTDTVARLLELPPASPADLRARRFDTHDLWMMWRVQDGGAAMFLERPYEDFQGGVTVTVQWHHSPEPETIAAMVRAYIRHGRREQRRPSWLARMLRWR